MQKEVLDKDVDGPLIETAREARGGFLGLPVLVVLVISTALAAAVLVGAWMLMT